MTKTTLTIFGTRPEAIKLFPVLHALGRDSRFVSRVCVSAQHRAMLDQVLTCSAIGDASAVKAKIEAFVERTGADELMITSQIYDHQARLRSYEIVAEAMV